MKSFIVLILSFISFASLGFPIPKDNIATFDIIRKFVHRPGNFFQPFIWINQNIQNSHNITTRP